MRNKMKKIIVLLFLSSFLATCGGGGDGGDNGGGGSGAINTDTPSLEQISGVWDATKTSTLGGTPYEYIEYTVITSDSWFASYDYQNDAYANAQGVFDDCYNIQYFTITDLGGGNFELINNQTGARGVAHFSRDNNLLTVTPSDNSSQVLISTTLQESDFTPVCGAP